MIEYHDGKAFLRQHGLDDWIPDLLVLKKNGKRKKRYNTWENYNPSGSKSGVS